jgi:hypothetical protein
MNCLAFAPCARRFDFMSNNLTRKRKDAPVDGEVIIVHPVSREQEREHNRVVYQFEI